MRRMVYRLGRPAPISPITSPLKGGGGRHGTISIFSLSALQGGEGRGEVGLYRAQPYCVRSVDYVL